MYEQYKAGLDARLAKRFGIDARDVAPWHYADPFFQADRLHVEGSFALEPSFAVLVVLEGAGQLGEMEVHKGSTVVVPHAAGEIGLTGDLVAIRCRPPVLSTVEDVSP